MTSPSLADFAAAHEQLFEQYNELCATLTDEQMGTQSLCPDWKVRDVITHAIGVEAVLNGWAPSVEDPPPFEQLAAFTAEADGLNRDGFGALITSTTSSRLSEMAELDPSVVDAPSITPTGIDTYGRFLQVRIFDLWVHLRDIAIPLGTATDDSGFSAETALAEVGSALGYIVGKKIGLPRGKSIAFHIEGEVADDLYVEVAERATPVDSLDAPDVELFSDVGTFVMLAAGRIDPEAQIDSGTIRWTGDAEWGRTAAENLAYTR